jgi:hypothetical protein
MRDFQDRLASFSSSLCLSPLLAWTRLQAHVCAPW